MDSDVSVFEMHNKIRDEILRSYGDDSDFDFEDRKALWSRGWFKNRSVSSINASTSKSCPQKSHHTGLLRIANKLGWFTTPTNRNESDNELELNPTASPSQIYSTSAEVTSSAHPPAPNLTASVKAHNQAEKEKERCCISEKSKAMSALLSKGTNVKNIYKEKFCRPCTLSYPHRVVVISGIPGDFGLNMVLSQVCGGPLEYVMLVSHGQYNIAKLYYIFAADAHKFYEYAHASGDFQFNGAIPRVEWANHRNADDHISMEPLPRYLMHQITNLSSRRVLILTKKVAHKKSHADNRLYYPNAATHFSVDLDINEVKKDFGSFGDVLEVSPVVSRKLCFSVQYADIRSAIIAKSECETEDSIMNHKYRDWKVWYSKDITDKPCYF